MNNWTTLVTVDQSVHRGWNVLKTIVREHFRYIRFAHDQRSQCSLGELRLFGVRRVVRNIDLTSVVSPVTYVDPFNSIVLASSAAVEYRQDNTGTIDSVVPPYGDIFGGYDIVLKGTNLDFSTNATVVIDGIACVYKSSDNISLTCTVGAKPSTSKLDSFVVEIGGKIPFIRQRFTYVLKWSDVRTWGTDLPPVDGDLIYVPAGQKLLIDQDTPQVVGISAKNASVIIPNNTNITIKTGFITIIGGEFIAGTEEHHLDSNVTFILSGDYYGPQQPYAGNKGIFCYECKFSMYGLPRNKIWTTVASTIQANDKILTVS